MGYALRREKGAFAWDAASELSLPVKLYKITFQF